MTNPPPTAPHSIDEFVHGYEDNRSLRGFRCAHCGTATATWGLACSRCGGGPLEEATLADRGQIVAGTIVAVAPGDFVNDAPYAYVLVELVDGARVSGWMPNVRAAGEIAPGTPVRFVPSYKPGVQFARATEATSLGSPR